jgi:hypothetical protein
MEADTGLPNELELLYNALPDTFTNKQAEETCIKLNLPIRKYQIALRRKDFGKLFRKVKHGEYTKTT